MCVPSFTSNAKYPRIGKRITCTSINVTFNLYTVDVLLLLVLEAYASRDNILYIISDVSDRTVSHIAFGITSRVLNVTNRRSFNRRGFTTEAPVTTETRKSADSQPSLSAFTEDLVTSLGISC